jgi:hypothetical protein
MKHKHAELIKAWADGAKIEFFNVFQEWVDADNPEWKEGCIYRIKPKPKTDNVFQQGVGCWVIGKSWHIYVQEKPNLAQIKNTRTLLGWEWEDAK